MAAHTSEATQLQPGMVRYRPPQKVFRTCLGRFATGVAVVTFDDADGRRRGLTINSFSSISMDPPLVLVSIGRRAKAHDLLQDRPFTVNVLAAEQEALARQFAGESCTEPRWVEGEVAPRLDGVLSWFECRPWAAYDGGDHTMYVGEVVHLDTRHGDALGFFCGQFFPIPAQS